MNHDDMPDLLPGYVLGALDADEHEQVSRHLGACPHCQIAAERDRVVVEQVAFAAPRRRPGPHVKARLMERIAQEHPRAGAAPLPSVRGEGRWARVRRLPPWLMVAAIVPWLVVLGLVIAFMAAPRNTPRVHMIAVPLRGPGGETGRLAMMPGMTTAYLMLTHMPVPRRGERFVCWLKRGGTMDYVSSFGLMPHSDDAAVMLHAPRPLDGYSAIAVSLETRPRPAHPSGTLLAHGAL